MKGKIVYLHRNALTGAVFYVGKGANRGRAYDEYNRSKEWNSIVSRDYFDVEIIAQSLSNRDAFELEEFVIETIGIDKLVNKTKGGLGTRGLVHSEKSKESISRYMKNRSKEVVSKIVKKSANSRRENSNKYYQHIGTGEIIKSLSLACEIYGIPYKAEWQRQRRNSSNKVFRDYDKL